MSQIDTSSRRRALAALGEAAAGATGSVVSILALYPLDTTRTILQHCNPDLWRACICKVRAPPYQDAGSMPFFKLLRHIVDTEGWQRLYRGLGSALGGAGLSWALYFAWVINTRMKLAAQRRKKLTGTPSTSAEQLEEEAEAKRKENAGLAVKAVKETNTIAAVIALVRREGLLGWLSGIVPALILLINPAIQLAVYGWLRKLVQEKRGTAPRATDAFVMGALSKFFAVIFTFPAQTIKLRIQAGLTAGERIRKIQSLWAGVGNKMVTSMLHAAVMFSVVEVFRAFNRMFARRHLKRLT